ncbi:hypothetical protein [Streptomyces sp. NPDC002758]
MTYTQPLCYVKELGVCTRKAEYFVTFLGIAAALMDRAPGVHIHVPCAHR